MNTLLFIDPQKLLLMFKITMNSKTIFSFGNIIATLIYIFAISSPYWIAKQNDGSTGVFESQSQHSNSLYYTSCTDDMSQLDCGFLYAAKISAVATIIFGGTAAVLYSFPTNLYALVPKNFTIIANALQISLAIITVVVFYYFKSDLYDDDGINAEYPSEESPSVKLSVSYVLWALATVLSAVLLTVQLFLRYREMHSTASKAAGADRGLGGGGQDYDPVENNTFPNTSRVVVDEGRLYLN